jgi:acetyl-CoA carboxylase biotin carboxyl carrier protein
MDLKEIKKIIQMVEEANISHLSIEENGVRIEIDKEFPQPEAIHYAAPAQTVMPSQPMPVAEAPPIQQQAPQVSMPEKPEGIAIKSQMVGTFYASPNPDSPPYVKVGDTIQKGQVVCIIEAMKLFNEIVAEQSGKVMKCCLETAAPVEYGQDLFIIE